MGVISSRSAARGRSLLRFFIISTPRQPFRSLLDFADKTLLVAAEGAFELARKSLMNTFNEQKVPSLRMNWV
jgi:hypothetical protein